MPPLIAATAAKTSLLWQAISNVNIAPSELPANWDGYPDHDHLHCTNCQKLIEFQSDELSAMFDKVAEDHRFRMAAHRLIISGLCHDCAQNRRRRKRKQDLV